MTEGSHESPVRGERWDAGKFAKSTRGAHPRTGDDRRPRSGDTPSLLRAVPLRCPRIRSGLSARLPFRCSPRCWLGTLPLVSAFPPAVRGTLAPVRRNAPPTEYARASLPFAPSLRCEGPKGKGTIVRLVGRHRPRAPLSSRAPWVCSFVGGVQGTGEFHWSFEVKQQNLWLVLRLVRSVLIDGFS